VRATQADFDGECLALSGKAGTQAVPIGPRVCSALSWYLRHRPPPSAARPSYASVSAPPGTALNAPGPGDSPSGLPGRARIALRGPNASRRSRPRSCRSWASRTEVSRSAPLRGSHSTHRRMSSEVVIAAPSAPAS